MAHRIRARLASRSRLSLTLAVVAALVVGATVATILTQVVLRDRYASVVESYRELRAEVARLTSASGGQGETIESLEQALASLQADLEQAEAAADAAQSRATEAEERAAAAEQLAGDLRLEFDPDIQARIASAHGEAIEAACHAAEAAASEGTDPPTLGSIIEAEVDVPGVPADVIRAELDPDEIQAEIERCTAAATLTADKADGFYLVGDEISPGSWRSRGGGSGCFWQRLASTGGGFEDTIANGGGVRNTIVTIAPTDEAFSSSGCGGWTFQD